MGSFKKASEEVMATRRIVKVRRQQPSSSPSTNPFTAIRFTPSDTSAQASIPVSEPQPSDVMTANIKDSCSSEKADGGSNGSGKYVSSTDKSTGSSEVAEIQNDESVQKESDAKIKSSDPSEAPPQPVVDEAKYTGDGSGDDNVVAEEAKEENSKTSVVEIKTKGVDVEEKNGVNEAGSEDKISKGDAEKKDGHEPETKDGSSEEQKDADNKGQSSSPTPLFSFKNLSSGQNAFTGLAGTGFSGSSFSFGSASKESSSASLFAEASKKFAMPEGPVETGEENEKAVFSADSALSRLVMRAKGNYRLILNASLYEDMSLKDMDKKGVTFACMNSIGDSQSGLVTFALKFRDTSLREEFKSAVETYKARKVSDALKTPESSPKASDD
ncbi:hypothetical protein GUJ93_ZPchr0005g14778 [Zizania palustris]|uniref:RanBD1 domain-containing protein n=1 Tax=Zizania palustris TaxID=103762 RepID=A0A8J5SW06_ZIZPA|nr:hypothetical protein GUJ93_ZPchr0005g14778 [Zizania palustris]